MLKAFKFILNYPKFILSISIIICLILSIFIFKLNIDANANNLLLDNDKDLQVFRENAKKYESSDFLFLALDSKDPFSKESLKQIRQLHFKLEQIDGVASVLSIINAPLLKSNQNLKDNLNNIPNILSDNININKAKEEIKNNPFFKKNIISTNGEKTALVIYLQNNKYYQELLEKIKNTTDNTQKKYYKQELKKETKILKNKNTKIINDIKEVLKEFDNKPNKLHLGGVPMIADDMISYIKIDILVYGCSLFVILAVILFLFFRNFRFIFLTLFICFINLISVTGLFALFGFDITVVSSNYVSLLLIINVSLLIHLITHFNELRARYLKASYKYIILATLMAKARASFYAILTTAIGFLSLIVSNIKPISSLGIMVSVGIFFILIFSFLFFASILILFDPIKKVAKRFDNNFLQFCANFSIKKQSSILFISLIIIVISFFGIIQLKVENSFVNYFKDNSEIKQGLVLIDNNLGGTLPLDIIIKFNEEKEALEIEDDFEAEFNALADLDTYWFDSKKTRIAKIVHEYLENKKYVGSVLSLNSLLLLGKDINNGKELDDFALAFLNKNLPNNLKQSLLNSYVNIDNNELRFVLRIIDSDKNLKRNEFLQKIKNDLNKLLEKENVSIQINGMMLLYNNMLQTLFQSQFDTIVFVVLGIFIFFVIAFKNVKLATIGIIANIIPLSLIFALMGFLDFPLDFMSITIASIAIGIGVDDAVHYIYRFKRELTNKKTIKEAIINSHIFTGSAIYYTTIAIVVGFGVMVTSKFVPTITFGLLTIFVMIFMLIGSLFLLPALLNFAYKKIK